MIRSPLPKKRTRLTPEQAAEILREWAAGVPAYEIAARFGADTKYPAVLASRNKVRRPSDAEADRRH